MSIEFKSILNKNKIVPVAVFDNRDEALKIAEILLNNSIDILEITLRTDNAYSCIEAVAKEYPDMNIGAGSLLSIDALKKAYDHGARFGVGPCLDMDLIDCASSIGINFIPGIATPTELHNALKKCKIIKIFPISMLGGVEYIQAVIGPFRLQEFYLVPTGGINENNFTEYLKADKVIACGMTYIVDSKLIKKGEFNIIDDRIKSIISRIN